MDGVTRPNCKHSQLNILLKRAVYTLPIHQNKVERKVIFTYKIISEEYPRGHCIFPFQTKFNKNTHFRLNSCSTKGSCCSIWDLVESMPCPNPGNKHIQKVDMGNFTGKGPIHHCLHLHFLSLCYLSSRISQCPTVFQDSWKDVICNINLVQHEVAKMVKKEGA